MEPGSPYAPSSACRTCSFEGTLAPQGTNEWRSVPNPDSPECKLVLEQTKDTITVTASSCEYYCGARASLDSEFARRRR